jgi:Rps23 Pro-64 3,4-dihydroxylase Tpa1-like proline 4-hydroxylase
MFELNKGLDPLRLAESYREHGRLQITNFLSEDSADALHRELSGSQDWRLAVNRGEEIRHFGLEEVAAWPDERRKLLDRAVTMGGRFGFQFRYDVIRTDQTSGPLLSALAGFLSSPELVDFMRIVTGASDIAFADAHASRYRPGHFLTTHDDHADTMGRRAAYVLNLTPMWRPDWGGILQFYDHLGNIVRGFTPGYNQLNIFKVPQPHSVTWVTPLAAEPRYAVTGWLRATGGATVDDQSGNAADA